MIEGQRGRLKRTKRLAQFKPGYKCKWCDGDDHLAISCFLRPKKPLPVQSEATKLKVRKLRRQWFKMNPSDENGNWLCYLQIAEDCPKLLTTRTITLEHVRAKTRSPGLKFCVENIKASCSLCNKLKASWSILDLSETYPNIFDMFSTPEWQAYELKLDELEAKA